MTVKIVNAYLFECDTCHRRQEAVHNERPSGWETTDRGLHHCHVCVAKAAAA